MGHALIGKHLSLKSVSGIERKMRKETEALTKAIAEVEAADLESLSDDALSSLYRRFQGEFADWGGATAATSEPMAYAGEEEIEDMLAGRGLEGNEKKRLKSLLTATTKESYTLRQMRELLEIAEKYGIRKGNFKRKVKEPRILSAIAAHAKRYHWMHNGYLTTYVLGSGFFQNELMQLLMEKTPEAHLKGLGRGRREFLDMKETAARDLHLTSRESKIFQLIDFFGYQQDYMKGFILKAVRVLDCLLAEIGRRRGIPLLDMKYSIPNEIGLIMAGKLGRKTLSPRMRNCLLSWREGAKKCELRAGSMAISEERKLGLETESGEGLLEIQGISANPGRVQGVAFVTMKASKANRELEGGEILVTSMTSPDFAPAIRRAAAIVTNEGGITCHAAIISREFGIPCVVATKFATKAIKSGEIVEVDGNHGFVRILKRMR